MAVAKKRSSTSPPDGGWGWMIVIGCFLVTICTRAVTRCISIFFVEFQTYFAQDYARDSLDPFHCRLCYYVVCMFLLDFFSFQAPLGSFVSNHVSSQVGIMLGGLLASAGFILSSFATTLEHLYLSLGILTGLGFALSYSPAIAMVGNYFHKRKALAYGIAMSGCGIGTFILAPVVQLLIEHFSWRGALLILGGFVLNLCVCGALMRPIEGKEDHKNMLEFSEQEFELEAQKSGFKQWSFCSPMIKLWSHKCVCHCSQQEYNFVLMPDFVVLAVSILFMAYGCSPLFVYLVPYSLSVGVSHQQAAFLMSVLGVIDIIGNITFGWLMDQRCLKKYRYVCYLFAVAMDGLCCLFLPVLQSFQLLLPFSFTFGYFDGAYITLIPVVTADVVGTASLSSALGMIYFLHAVPYLVSPPVAAERLFPPELQGDFVCYEYEESWTWWNGEVKYFGPVGRCFSHSLRLACGYNWQLYCIFLALWFSMVVSSTLLCCARLAKITPTSSGPVGRDTRAKQESWTNGTIVYLVTGELDQRSEELLAGEPNSHSKR